MVPSTCFIDCHCAKRVTWQLSRSKRSGLMRPLPSNCYSLKAAGQRPHQDTSCSRLMGGTSTVTDWGPVCHGNSTTPIFSRRHWIRMHGIFDGCMSGGPQLSFYESTTTTQSCPFLPNCASPLAISSLSSFMHHYLLPTSRLRRIGKHVPATWLMEYYLQLSLEFAMRP